MRECEAVEEVGSTPCAEGMCVGETNCDALPLSNLPDVVLSCTLPCRTRKLTAQECGKMLAHAANAFEISRKKRQINQHSSHRWRREIIDFFSRILCCSQMLRRRNQRVL